MNIFNRKTPFGFKSCNAQIHIVGVVFLCQEPEGHSGSHLSTGRGETWEPPKRMGEAHYHVAWDPIEVSPSGPENEK